MMNCFDIIGPIMVGPSSSHTAGAVRIGLVAKALLDERIKKADIGLCGSFAHTFRGHGTDKAIVAGLLGFFPDDERICKSLYLARKAGLDFTFHLINQQDLHPNTAIITLWGEQGRRVTIRGVSTGGGRIRIEAIDDIFVSFSGDYTTLVINHQDTPGVVAGITHRLALQRINIASMRVFRSYRGGPAVTVIETDEQVDQSLCQAIGQVDEVRRAVLVQPVSEWLDLWR